MRKRNVLKLLKEDIRAKYDMSSELDDIKSQMNFTFKDRNVISFNKFKFITASVFILLFAMTGTGVGTYFVAENAKDQLYNVEREYFYGRAQEYMSEYCLGEYYPLVSYYIKGKFIFNIYRGSYEDDENEIQIIYLYQICYILNAEYDMTLTFENENEESFVALIKNSNIFVDNHDMGIIDDENFTMASFLKVNIEYKLNCEKSENYFICFKIV